MKLDGCHALITGASAGIGEEFARQLAPRAASLLLVARRIDRLEELRHALERQNSNVRIRSVDLSSETDLRALCDWIEHEKIPINFLINNAGLGDSGTVVTSEPQRVKEMILVNVLALTLLTRGLLPLLIAQKSGAILNVSSSAGFLPIPTAAIYAATKAYVTSFSEALRIELLGTGVTVTALCPGPVETEFHKVAARRNGRREKAPAVVYVPVDQVVRDALRGVEKNRPIVIPGFFMKLGITLVRLMPMPILRLAGNRRDALPRVRDMQKHVPPK